MKSSFVLVLGLLAAPAAEADTCKRWVNELDACDGLVAQNVCSEPSLWSPNQWINYNNWHLSSTPKKACKKYVQKAIDPDAESDVIYINEDLYYCYWDWDGDGLDEDDFDGGHNLVSNDDITKDDCCTRAPAGRYDDGIGLPVHNKAGNPFTKEQREDIIDQNMKASHVVKSDAYRAGVTDPGTGANGTLATSNATYYAADDPDPDAIPLIPYRNNPEPGDAQIDHIIPRIDSHGCPCGDNSIENAAVISAELNAGMGRSCLDSRRVKFLNTWSRPRTSTRDVADDDAATSCGPDGCNVADAVDPAGGCTATPGDAGVLMLVLGGLFAVGRRRRSIG